MSIHPLFIDNIVFAKKNERLEGVLSLADCPRLAELLQHEVKYSQPKVNTTAKISYMLQGKIDAAGQHFLHLSLTADLISACQRCLGEMPLKIALNFNYLIGEIDDIDLSALDIDNSDDTDLQQANQNMDIIALIEDEIIMAMPIAPIHDEDCGAMITQSGEKINPFSVLKSLIKP